MAKYVMKSGDKIRRAGAYMNAETGEWEQKARHLLCADGRELKMGTFESADRAAAAKKRPKKKAAKRGDKAHKTAE
jgi:hypothetical protein